MSANICIVRCADVEFCAISPKQSTDWIVLLKYFGTSVARRPAGCAQTQP